MYLSAYHFDGDPTTLVEAHERMLAAMPHGFSDLHACVVEDHGITVLDACPTKEVFEGFSASEDFRAALAAAGLPSPRVEPLGVVHSLDISDRVAVSR